MESEDVAVADAAAFVVGAGVAGLVVEPDTVVVALVLVATVVPATVFVVIFSCCGGYYRYGCGWLSPLL